MAEKIETYQDAGGKFRFRVKAANGQTVASSGESFSSEAAAIKAAKGAKRIIANAPVVKAKPKPTAKAKPKAKPAAKAKPRPKASQKRRK